MIMKKILVVFGIMFIVVSVFAQSGWKSRYRSVQPPCNGHHVVFSDGKYGLVNIEGVEIIKPVFKGMLTEQPSCGMIGVSLDGKKWGYINLNEEVVVPFLYERVYSFSEGYGVIYSDKKSAMVDVNGKVIVPFIFDIIYPMKNGVAEIVDWCYFDSKAKGNVEFIGGRHGLIDGTGKVIAPLDYDDIGDFRDGIARFEKNQLVGLIDNSGKMLLRPICKEIKEFDYLGRAECLVYDRWVYVDTTGKFGDEVPGKNKPKRLRFPVDKAKLESILKDNMIFVKVEASKDNRCSVLPVYGDYFMSKYEVTFELFEMFLNAPDDKGDGYITTLERKGDPKSVEKLLSTNINKNSPVYNVSWKDCSEFCYWLSGVTGVEYALPTEAEWEYAARGGNKSRNYRYAGSDDANEVAWYSDNARNSYKAVGQKKCNELGLYDMSGNVWEWCRTFYDSKVNMAKSMSDDMISQERAVRGGSVINNKKSMEVDFREGQQPREPGGIGFRIIYYPN